MEILKNNDKINSNNNNALLQVEKELKNIIDYIQTNIDYLVNIKIDSNKEDKKNENEKKQERKEKVQ